MTMKPKTPKAAAAALVDEADRRRLADLRFADELNNMKSRCLGLELTINGAGLAEDETLSGVLRIAEDVTERMTQLASAFEAERQLRIAEARKEFARIGA